MPLVLLLLISLCWGAHELQTKTAQEFWAGLYVEQTDFEGMEYPDQFDHPIATCPGRQGTGTLVRSHSKWDKQCFNGMSVGGWLHCTSESPRCQEACSGFCRSVWRTMIKSGDTSQSVAEVLGGESEVMEERKANSLTVVASTASVISATRTVPCVGMVFAALRRT